MGTTAENVAKKYGISRTEQEAFAVESQAKATGRAPGRQAHEEITPIQNGKDQVVSDGCIREGTTWKRWPD
jgi:acetyl-CoA acyltransferase